MWVGVLLCSYLHSGLAVGGTCPDLVGNNGQDTPSTHFTDSPTRLTCSETTTIVGMYHFETIARFRDITQYNRILVSIPDGNPSANDYPVRYRLTDGSSNVEPTVNTCPGGTVDYKAARITNLTLTPGTSCLLTLEGMISPPDKMRYTATVARGSGGAAYSITNASLVEVVPEIRLQRRPAPPLAMAAPMPRATKAKRSGDGDLYRLQSGQWGAGRHRHYQYR